MIKQDVPYIILLEELFRIVITVDINLRNSIGHSRILATGLYTSFKPWQNQLQPIALFDFMYEFVDWEIAGYERGHARS